MITLQTLNPTGETHGTIRTKTNQNFSALLADTDKPLIVDADIVRGVDSVTPFGLVSYTWTNIKAFLKTYFDTLYSSIAILTTANTWQATQTEKSVLFTMDSIAATGNAAIIPITHRLHTVTNNSAATLTITITTAGAVDGQLHFIRVLDFSAVAQTLAWVNTENSDVSVPTTSNGSTTLPRTVAFQYNGATSKWRCIANV